MKTQHKQLFDVPAVPPTNLCSHAILLPHLLLRGIHLCLDEAQTPSVKIKSSVAAADSEQVL